MSQSNLIRTTDSNKLKVCILHGWECYSSRVMLFMGCVCVSANSQMDAGPGQLKRSSALTVVTAVWAIF